jgi:hypothetical protein
VVNTTTSKPVTLMEPDPPILNRVARDMEAYEAPVGEDVIRAHALFLSRLARPGTWFAGDERIAIAAEVRAAASCAFCGVRKEALSPYSVEGEHTSAPGRERLAPELVDRIHLAVSDAPRMTKAAIDSLGEVGLTAAHYVEALGIAAVMRSIDQACRGMGVPQHALPAPLVGEPSREMPPGLGDIGSFFPMIASAPPPSPNEDLWGEDTVNVIRALSGVPDAVRDVKLLAEVQYVPLDDFEDPTLRRTLSRPQMELIAARVSAVNECFY